MAIKLYHLHCSECGGIVATSMTPFEDKSDALCKHCSEELCLVLDYILQVRKFFNYWVDKISPTGKRTEKQRNAIDIARGHKVIK